jgi:hypothetical protein
MSAKLMFSLIMMVCVALLTCYIRTPWRQFDRLEQNAKNVITASELQIWATKVLAEYSTYSPSQLYHLRTNYPTRLRILAPGLGPDVCINEVNSTNSPDE